MKIDVFFKKKIDVYILLLYMKILEKVSNIIKNKFNSELIYSKKISKSWKEINTKAALYVYIHAIVLIDSISRKD